MEKDYDVIIIGTGVAGTTLASRLAPSGLRIATIDSREYGGTCPLRGCDPKKVLAGVSEAVDGINRLWGKGGGAREKLRIEWPSLIAFKRTFTHGYSQKIEKSLLEMGIDTYHGKASFLDENTVAADKDILRGVYIFVATGSKPVTLGIFGEEYLTTSEQFLDTEKLPEKIIFIGGGYISFEFAHIAKRAGSEVLVLHRSRQPLKQFDPEMVGLLLKASKAAGIEVLTNRQVTAIEKINGKLYVKTGASEGGLTEETFIADMVVHGAGRVPNIEGLQLERAGIEVRQGAIVTDKYMQTSNFHVYAGGDCTFDGLPLTPVATLQAGVAAANILSGNLTEIDYTGIPRAVFTIPALAAVGISGSEADKKHKVIFRDRSSWYSTRRLGLGYAASKVILDEEKDRILGAHILGPNAEEVINIFAMAMQIGLKASDLRKLVFAYPSVCSDIVYMI